MIVKNTILGTIPKVVLISQPASMSINHTKLIEEDVESGGKEETDTDEIKNDFAYNNNVQNASINIRLGNCTSIKRWPVNLKITSFPSNIVAS